MSFGKCKVPKSKIRGLSRFEFDKHYNVTMNCQDMPRVQLGNLQKRQIRSLTKTSELKEGFCDLKFKIKLRLTTSALFLCNEPAHGPNHPAFLQDMVDTNCIKLPHLWSWCATLLEHYPSKNCAKCRPRRFCTGLLCPLTIVPEKKRPEKWIWGHLRSWFKGWSPWKSIEKMWFGPPLRTYQQESWGGMEACLQSNGWPPILGFKLCQGKDP